MTEVVTAKLYDYPRYYDLVFGSDWKAEYDFLLGCFERFCPKPPQRLFEPACGTGRLLYRLAKAGYDISGNDLNPHAVRFCNARLKRHGLPETCVVGDMSCFQLRPKADAAFNLINSFRHLPSEEAARDHMTCMAAALKKGGLYLLGLHLTPAGNPECTEESWSARRGNLAVISHMWSLDIDRRKRQERIGMRFDIYTPTRQWQLAEETVFRTYTAPQFKRLVESTGVFEVVATYDFAYDLDDPVEVNEATEDVVYVLRKLG